MNRTNESAPSESAQSPTPDLLWDAARYVWGEMPAAEAAAFEQRLESDEQACCAVAEAVKLSAGLQAAVTRPSPAAHRRSITASPWGRRIAVTVSAAAALLAGIVWQFGQQTPRPVAMDIAAVELVDRWRAESVLGINLDHELTSDFEFEAESRDDSLSAPHWLLNAVEITSELN